MQHTAIDEGSSRRLLKLGVLAVIAAIVVSGGLLLRMKLAGGSGEQESYTPYTVGAMTLRAMVTSAGTSVAQNEAVLSFQKPGQLGEILVGLGDEVREGQPLMRLKTDDLENVAASAQSALTLAELQLQKLEEGSTDADISKANGAVATARAALTKAQNDLKVALDPATEARRTAAEQAVALAEANLAAAEAKLDALEEGASDAEYAAAEAAVTQAEAKLSQAQRGADDADSAIGDAQASFQTAAISYCDIVNGAGFECPNGSQTIPVQNICDAIETDHYETALNAGQVNAVSDCIDASATDATPQAETPTPTATALPISGIQLATTYLIYANTNYKTAITTANNAEDNVVIAQASLDAATPPLTSWTKAHRTRTSTPLRKALSPRRPVSMPPGPHSKSSSTAQPPKTSPTSPSPSRRCRPILPPRKPLATTRSRGQPIRNSLCSRSRYTPPSSTSSRRTSRLATRPSCRRSMASSPPCP